jgi:hypothetical protein
MKRYVPRSLRHALARFKVVRDLQELGRRLRNRSVRVVQRSPHDNIYHCCTQKTATQWIRAIFTDPITYRHTGLQVLPYAHLGLNLPPLGLRFVRFDRPFPTGTFAACLPIGYPTYLSIPKPERYKAFFVLRDPRDIVVSWYFSAMYSHLPFGPIPGLRADLEKLDFADGMRHMIDTLDEWGSFSAQRSWMEITEDRERIAIFRFEDLASDERLFLQQLFEYLDIAIPEQELTMLCNRHTFERHSKGRRPGEEDRLSHYRKGIVGDWRNHFDRSTTAYFRQVTGDLLEVLGYQD